MESDISGDDRMEVLLLESVERVRKKGTWSVGDRMEFFVGLCEDIHFRSRPSVIVSRSETAYFLNCYILVWLRETTSAPHGG